MDKVSTERLRELIARHEEAAIGAAAAGASDDAIAYYRAGAAALRELLAIRAEVEAQRPTAEEMLKRAIGAADGWVESGKTAWIRNVLAAITHEREVVAARELALKAERDQFEHDALSLRRELYKAEERAAAAEKALTSLVDRTRTIADELCGTQPVLSGEDAMTLIEQAANRYRIQCSAAEKALADAIRTLEKWHASWTVTDRHTAIRMRVEAANETREHVAALASTLAPPQEAERVPYGVCDLAGHDMPHWRREHCEDWRPVAAPPPAQPVAPAPLPPEVRAALRRALDWCRKPHGADRLPLPAADLALLAPLAEEPR